MLVLWAGLAGKIIITSSRLDCCVVAERWVLTTSLAILLWLVLTTLWLAYKARFARHRALAKVTFPVWLYVSVTGVVVYMMLYAIP